MARIHALNSPALSAILRLSQAKALNMREFSFAAQVSPLAARKVLKTLRDLDLVVEKRDKQGATKIAEIRLTATGQKVARLVASIDALLPSEE